MRLAVTNIPVILQYALDSQALLQLRNAIITCKFVLLFLLMVNRYFLVLDWSMHFTIKIHGQVLFVPNMKIIK